MGAKKISQIKAPMQAVVYALGVAVGDQVSAGQEVAVLEAMKMQTTLYASADGTVDDILVQVEDSVESKDLIARLR